MSYVKIWNCTIVAKFWTHPIYLLKFKRQYTKPIRMWYMHLDLEIDLAFGIYSSFPKETTHYECRINVTQKILYMVMQIYNNLAGLKSKCTSHSLKYHDAYKYITITTIDIKSKFSTWNILKINFPWELIEPFIWFVGALTTTGRIAVSPKILMSFFVTNLQL